ncbi:hypothetical protein IGI04_005881 [Brassica rapa subsp. trilocularis]|uniref:Branched-chain-amino-acid aminotransferase n=1 Tax=Brassica rapa subsp. trilocularis TaxID=1813537 RepID=A0ABQ7NF95_BRACM|nr:hypothetical protein IGI04_005881 [Brassica rapa subsp. trilocularis]
MVPTVHPSSSSCLTSEADEKYANVNWEELGFTLIPTDYSPVRLVAAGFGVSGSGSGSGSVSGGGSVNEDSCSFRRCRCRRFLRQRNEQELTQNVDAAAAAGTYGNQTNSPYMYVAKCKQGESFSEGKIVPYGDISISPSAGILNYGQGLFEGLKAYRTQMGRITLFRPEQNALRMQMGADRLCMTPPSVDQFVEAVKQTVIANKKWVPPPGKGTLYIRPLLIGSGCGPWNSFST